MELTGCVTDDDYEAWRRVRMDVVPGERCDTVAEMRAQDSPARLLLLATVDGTVVGSGVADRSDTGGGFVAPRVRREHRRQGVGSALLQALADHVATLEVTDLRAMTEDPESLAFAHHFGFVDVDRQVEQVRAIGDEPAAETLPEGVEVVTLDERPELLGRQLRALRHPGARRLRGVPTAPDHPAAVERLVGRRPDVPGPPRR